jgi:hypothetical protein
MSTHNALIITIPLIQINNVPKDLMRINYRMNPLPQNCLCFVRLHKKNGFTCPEPCLENEKMCKKHQSLYKTSIPYLTTYILKQKTSHLSKISYEHIRPMLLEMKHQKILSQSYFADILSYIYTIDILKNYIRDLYLCTYPKPPKFSKVSEVASYIAKLFIQLIEIETNKQHLNAIQRLQYDWRKYYKEKFKEDQGPWPTKSAVNEEDPITLDPLTDLDAHEIWSYEDKHGNVYAFLARKLYHFIETNGPWNPYTREIFEKNDMDRLKRMIKRLPKESFKIVWRNAHDAFTDVLYDYERYGFYTSIDWFLQLTPNDIIHIYQHMREDPYIPMYMFTYQLLEERLIENPDEGAHLAFAKDMKYLMESNHSMKFYIVCNVFVALAQVCPILRNTLPQWTVMGASGVQG